MIAPEAIPRVYLTLRCTMHCWFCANGPILAEYEEIGAEAWLKRLEAFPCKEVIFSGGEPTLHAHFEAILRGLVEMGSTPHVYTNLEEPIPATMDDLAPRTRWRASCHSRTAEAAQKWVQRAVDAHERGFRVNLTTVYCPTPVVAVLREHSIVVNTPQAPPQRLAPPVRCTVKRIYLAPDGRRYHCVGKLVKADASGLVADTDGNTVICQTPDRCATCDGVVATRVAMT